MTLVRKIAGAGIALMLVTAPVFSTVARGQMAPRDSGTVIAASRTASDMDETLAREISQAWAENKDASGAVAFQENGEIAQSQGNDHQAIRYFQDAEHELGNLKPTALGAQSSAE